MSNSGHDPITANYSERADAERAWYQELLSPWQPFQVGPETEGESPMSCHGREEHESPGKQDSGWPAFLDWDCDSEEASDDL